MRHRLIFGNCLAAGKYRQVINSPLAGQNNSALRPLEYQVAYMDQITCKRFMRFKLYIINRAQVLLHQGVPFV
jgi:hypothetical protein